MVLLTRYGQKIDEATKPGRFVDLGQSFVQDGLSLEQLVLKLQLEERMSLVSDSQGDYRMF